MRNKWMTGVLMAAMAAVLLVPAIVFGEEVAEENLLLAETGVAQVGEQEYPTLQEAIDGACEGETVTLLRDLEVAGKIMINKKIILDGQGNTVTAAADFGSSDGTKQLLGIEGKASSGTLIKNITLNSNGMAYGVQPYNVKGTVYFENVTVTGSKGTGLTVNGASVIAEGLTVSGSKWYQSIDISNGLGVEGRPVLVLTNGSLEDPIGIFQDVDSAADKGNGALVTVNGKSYTPCLTYTGAGLKLIYMDEAADTIYVTSGATLETALEDAAPGSYIKLAGNITLENPLSIGKSVTIDGNGNTINGKADTARNGFEITDGNVVIRNVTLKDFGGDTATQNELGTVKVPDNTAVNLQLTDVVFENFNRSALDIRSGVFSMENCVIDCKSNSGLTKGIVAGLGSGNVKGTVRNVTITGSSSGDEAQSAGAVEVYRGAVVTLQGGRIENCQKGVHLDNYHGTTSMNASVVIEGTVIKAESYAVCVYGRKDARTRATAAIEGGNFTGPIAISGEKSGNEAIIIKGGSFSEDPSAYVADGYRVTGNDPYLVSKTPAATAAPKPQAPSDSQITGPAATPAPAATPVPTATARPTTVVSHSKPTETPAAAAQVPAGTPVVATAQVEATVTDTTAVAAVESKQLAAAVNQAKASEGASAVKVEVAAAPEAKAIQVALPAQALSTLATEPGATLTVTSHVAEVTFDTTALTSIVGQADEEIILAVSPVAAEDMSDAQAEKVSGYPTFELTLQSGDKVISDFNQGKATVTLPYVLSHGQQAEGVVVWYLEENGNTTVCETTYHAKTQKVTFVTSHFSCYAIAYDETLVAGQTDAELTEAQEPAVQEPVRESGISLPVVMAVAAVAILVMVFACRIFFLDKDSDGY